MISSPAIRPVPPVSGSAHPPRRGSNWAGSYPVPGHFLFPQAQYHGACDIANANEPGAAGSSGAATDRRSLLSAESRPFVFPQINDVFHADLHRHEQFAPADFAAAQILVPS